LGNGSPVGEACGLCSGHRPIPRILQAVRRCALLLSLLLAGCFEHGRVAMAPPPRAVEPAAPAAPAARTEVAPQPAETPPAPPPQETERSRLLTSSALLLGGLPAGDGGPLAELQDKPWWKDHARALGRAFAEHDAARLQPMRAWADTALAQLRPRARVVFYPFGGPDSLYPVALFPDALSYLLVGLEPVGEAPELTAMTLKQRQQAVKRLAGSVGSMLKLSFFRTEDIQRKLRDDGVLPVLLVLLARAGYRIQEVDLLSLQGNGTASLWTGAAEREQPDGARVTFLKPGEQPKHLFYFRQNLSDDVLPHAPHFLAMVRSLEPPVTFLKAASYLLHQPQFSEARSLILGHSAAVLEDDSGMPYRYFEPRGWDTQFFGTYTGPIQIFAYYRQSDLLQAFRERPPAALSFGLGYKYKLGQSGLMLAVKKSAGS
jgi:hypothetical protein